MLKDFDTLIVADDGGISTAIEGLGQITVGISDSVFLTSIATVIKGADGLNGADGQPGPPGGAVYQFTQAIPATQWDIHHNLGRFPPITVIDSSGNEIVGAEKYIDSNNVQLNFTFAFAGNAYLG